MTKYTYQRNENGDFTCPHCPKVVPAKNASTMHYHLKRHEGNLPFACKSCDYKCLFQRTLDLHSVSKHPNEKQAQPISTLKCPINGCTFESLTKGNCIIHFMRKHCKPEVAQILSENDTCSRCNLEFQSNTAFQYHATSCIQIQDATKAKMLQTLLAN